MAIIVNLDVMMAKRKITLGDLADRIGITPQFVRSSIANRRIYSNLRKMKREVLDMNDYFLTICKYARPYKGGRSA